MPDHWSFIAASRRAVPIHAVMWVSWPQACITPVSTPERATALTFDANGRPVCSTTGSASMSARSISTGPGPFFITATTPDLPTFSVTVKPSLRTSAASLAGERTSCIDNSGLAWRSRYSVINAGMSALTPSAMVAALSSAGNNIAASANGNRTFIEGTPVGHCAGVSSRTSVKDSKWG